MNFQMQACTALKKMLKAKGIKYEDLAAKTGLSLPTIKRILSKGDMTLSRLEEICLVTDIAVSDVLRLITTLSEEQPEELTEEQEKYLAKFPNRFAYYDLLLNGMKPKQIEAEFKLTKAQTIKLLSDLDKWKLIEWEKDNKVKLLTSDYIRLRKDGPLRKLFESKCLDSFLEDEFIEQLAFKEFRTFRLSENSLRKLNHKLRELLVEIGKESDIESQAQVPTHGLGAMFAIRKWRLVDAFELN